MIVGRKWTKKRALCLAFIKKIKTDPWRLFHGERRKEKKTQIHNRKRFKKNRTQRSYYLNKGGDEMTIKELRTAAKMTQKAFSEYLKIPKRTIEQWEGGQRTPPKYLVELIEYKLKKENLI